MNVNPKIRTAIYAVAAVIAVAVIAVVWYFLLPRNVVLSTFVSNGPQMDGSGNDSVWTKTEAKTVPMSNDQNIEIKSVYSTDRVFLLLRFKSPQPNKTERAWTFNGKSWKRGGASDQLALFFVMNDTIPDFKKKGFDIMTYGLEKDDSLWGVGIAEPSKPKGEWAGAADQADYWLWGAGVTNPWGGFDDLYFSINREYAMSPTTTSPLVATRWDAFTNVGVVQANTALWREAAQISEGAAPQSQVQDGPIYMYSDGETFADNPYPVVSDLQSIPSGQSFKKGEQLPFIFFEDETKGKWGASRDDISARGVWKDGYWTIEVSRKLKTAYGDDIVFAPAVKEDVDYSFGLLTRTGDKGINRSVPAILRFRSKGGN